VVVALFVATLLAALDQTIFATALPTIVGDLHGLDQMLWVTTAYILASTIIMPVYGKLGDIFGHKVLLLSSLALFLACSPWSPPLRS
jgi:MFS family permease